MFYSIHYNELRCHTIYTSTDPTIYLALVNLTPLAMHPNQPRKFIDSTGFAGQAPVRPQELRLSYPPFPSYF